MKPEDLLFLIGTAIIILIVVAITLMIFRKRKKWARIIVGVIVGGYVIFFAMYPSIRSYMHAQLSTAEHLSQQCGTLSHRVRMFEPPVAEYYTTFIMNRRFTHLLRAYGKLKWLDIEPLRA